MTKAFVPLPGGATAVYSGTPTALAWYRHPHWLGSSRIASTPSRTVYYDGAYSPQGEIVSETGTADRNFTGQNQDLGGDLYDFPYREYRAGHGRWIRPDPAGLAAADPTNPQSWNRYAYANGSPMNLVDPLGLDAVQHRRQHGADDRLSGGAGGYAVGESGGDRAAIGLHVLRHRQAVTVLQNGTGPWPQGTAGGSGLSPTGRPDRE